MWTGWLAAAACLALALLAWLPSLSARSTPAEQRAQLLNVRPTDLIQWSWTATADPAAQGARGDVVWSNARQEGYLTFRGLAPNNPTNEQYQLWIFDKNRPDATPVDGGVFDIPSGQAEVVIAIDPKIQVFDAAMFAVTIEKPGGVVVSKRERIPVLAQAPQQP
jgi:anti-sigma-K factor RskA